MYCIDATSLCICVKNIIFILIIIELNKIYWRRCYWKRKMWERSAIIANSPNSLFLFSPSANMLQVTACEHQYRELLWSLMLAWTSKFLSGAKLSDRSKVVRQECMLVPETSSVFSSVLRTCQLSATSCNKISGNFEIKFP